MKYKAELTLTDDGWKIVLMDKSIDIIIVEHKDRLARFGTNYIEKLINELNKDNEE